jgi:hypothetical protein
MTRKLLFSFLFLFSQFVFAQTYAGKLGFGVSPQGFPYHYTQLPIFLQEVSATCGGSVVYANGNWRDDTAHCGMIPGIQKYISASQPAPYTYTDMLTYAWASYPTLYLSVPANSANNWSNAQMKALFLQTLIRTADTLHPAYLFIGNEINFYIEQDSLDYINFINFYYSAYDSIKAHSPFTKVGTVFNFEHLSGNGALNGWNNSHWTAMDMMDTSKIDILGLSLYPFFNYQTANAIPLTYLDPIFTRMGNKPVSINETGWPGDSLIGTWSGNSQQQVDYVNKLFTMISGRNVEVVNWLFLNYALDSTNNLGLTIFKSVSMRDSLGGDRPAFALWRSMCPDVGIPENPNRALITVYPNPSSGKIIFDAAIPFTNNEIEIFNAEGELVFRKINLIDKQEIDLQLSSGIYFYRFMGNEVMQDSGKIIISEN